MLSYDEEEEEDDSDIFGESDGETDDNDTKVCLLELCLSSWGMSCWFICYMREILMIRPSFRAQARRPLLMNWQLESKLNQSTNQQEMHVSLCHYHHRPSCHICNHLFFKYKLSLFSHPDCHPCMCMLMNSVSAMLSLKHWHLRRKVKAGKNQSLQNRRVGISFIRWKPTCFCLILHLLFSAGSLLCLL